MVALLALLFLAVPVAELAVILKVGAAIGIVNTLAVLIVVSLVGGWLVKREGLSVLRRIQHQLELRRLPGAELVDGLLVLAAGALLLTPGFLTDVVGILLLLPPVRAVMRGALRRRFERRITIIP